MAYIDTLAEFIKRKEGRSLKAYFDPNNDANRNQTGPFAPDKGGSRYAIGYGHNFGQSNSPEVRAGKITLGGGVSDIILRGTNGKDTTITEQQALALLKKDLPRYESNAKNEWQKTFGTTSTWESLPDNQKTALVSYTYNAGPGGLSQLISRGDFKDAIAATNALNAGKIIRDYGVRTAQGQGVVQALVDRRQEEGALFANVSAQSFGFGVGGVDISASPTSVSDYIKRTYIDPIKKTLGNKDSEFLKVLNDEVTPRLVVSQGLTFKEYLQSNGLFNNSQLNGEKTLLNLATEAQAKLQAEQSTIRARIDDIPSAAAAFLIQHDLFELSPDLMRTRMAANAGNSFDLGAPTENYSHAWRSPGKLAITADLTIPGASGFRIGQIFRVGRTYDHYNRYGAFQLFGLTEEITVGRGWTTTIHSRFNAMPIKKVADIKSF